MQVPRKIHASSMEIPWNLPGMYMDYMSVGKYVWRYNCGEELDIYICGLEIPLSLILEEKTTKH